jgi:hypothetical protein
MEQILDIKRISPDGTQTQVKMIELKQRDRFTINNGPIWVAISDGYANKTNISIGEVMCQREGE